MVNRCTIQCPVFRSFPGVREGTGRSPNDVEASLAKAVVSTVHRWEPKDLSSRRLETLNNGDQND